MKEGDQQFLPARHQSDLEGASTDDAGSQRPPPSSPTSRDKHDKDLPMEAGKDRGRVYLACRQCRSRKIKCDGTRPVCATCIKRKSPKCQYDDGPKRRGPDRHPRARPHQNSGPSSSSTRARRSQKRSSNDVAASVIPSTSQSLQHVASDSGATTPQMVLSNRPPSPLRQSSDSMRYYPPLGIPGPSQHGSEGGTLARNFFGNSPSVPHSSQMLLPRSATRPLTPSDSLLLPPVSRLSRSEPNSLPNPFDILNPEFSPSIGARDQSRNLSFLLNPSDERPYPNFGHRSTVVDPRSHNSYLPDFNFQRGTSSASPDNNTQSSAESPYTPVTIISMHGGSNKDEARRQIDGSPYILASSSFPTSIGTNIAYSGPSAEAYLFDSLPKATGHIPPFTHNTNFLPIASSPMKDESLYARFQESGKDFPRHDDSEADGSRSSTPDALAAHAHEMLNQPSAEFSRQVWWEALTRYYGGPKAAATRRIMDDISHLFRVSNYFVAFINVPLFFSTFHHPSQRENVQPSLVLSILAFSTLLQSSDLGMGSKGRYRALELRDQAQSHLEMSLNAGWISPGLAQAALLLVMFEVTCHPAHSESRARSTLFLLDSLILGLGLLDMDKEERSVTTFASNTAPSLLGPVHDSTTWGTADRGVTKRGCSCSQFQIANMSPSSRKITPFWLSSPGWKKEWDVVEIRREEQRRLVWSALNLASAHLAFFNAVKHTSLNLGIAKAWNFKVLFPGETLFPTSQAQDNLGAKHTVWALHSRCHMLYSSCLSVHYDETLSEYEKGQFAVQAWLESERIEKMLDMHTCEVEKATLYSGREYLFNTQSLVSSQYSRYVPHPNLGDPHFNRGKAVLWLNHQKHVAQYFLGGLPLITGLKENMLSNRPYFIFWFHGQIARYLGIWQQDTTLHIALYLCIELLPPLEYLMAIFPSDYQRQKYEAVHRQLVDACIIAGIPPPPPPSYVNLQVVL